MLQRGFYHRNNSCLGMMMCMKWSCCMLLHCFKATHACVVGVCS
jgi:hypothetical protein